jgi:hypothetical protein
VARNAAGPLPPRWSGAGVSGGSARPHFAARGTVDDAEELTDRQLDSQLEPGLQLFPAPCVHADVAVAPALAAMDKQRAAAVIQISFGERQRFLDA